MKNEWDNFAPYSLGSYTLHKKPTLITRLFQTNKWNAIFYETKYGALFANIVSKDKIHTSAKTVD